MTNRTFIITFSAMMLTIMLLHGCTSFKTGEQDADALWCVGACVHINREVEDMEIGNEEVTG